MTQSTHTYTATLAPATPLKVHEENPGEITLDTTSAPHVTGTLRLASADESLLGDLDPRQSPPPRVTVVADAVFPLATQHREFNLTVRGLDRDQETGEPILTLASDEALTGDFRVGADDPTPLTHRDSLYDLVNYALDLAIPGAALEPGTDEPVLVLSDSENLIRNPRCGVNTTDWATTWSTGGLTAARIATGGPSDSPTYYAVQATGGATTGGYIYITDDAVSVRPLTEYRLSVWVRAHGSQQVRADAWMLDATPTIVGATTPAPATPAGSWVRLVVSFRTTATTTRLRPRVVINGTLASSAFVDVTGWRLSEFVGDDEDIQYFDGDTTDTAEYEYGFGSASHASPSRRTAVVDAATPDSLILQTGQTVLDFLLAVTQRAGRRLVCDEQRNWTLRTAGYLSPGSTTIRHGINLTAGDERISRDDDIWCDACVVIYEWTDRAGAQQRRVDYFSLVSTPTRVREIRKDTPYPGPGLAQYTVERAQGRGREVTASAVADWDATTDQLASIWLSGSPTQTGTVQRVTFVLSNDEMRVTCRTTDTPDDAWLLDDPDDTWLDTDPDEPWEP